MNIQDGMLTTHSERTYLAPEAELLREFLGAPDEMIDCPTPAQRDFSAQATPRPRDDGSQEPHPPRPGPKSGAPHEWCDRRRNNFNEPILKFLEQTYEEFGHLTGRYYHLVTDTKPRMPTRCLCLSAARLRTLRRPVIIARPTHRQGRLHPCQRHPPFLKRPSSMRCEVKECNHSGAHG